MRKPILFLILVFGTIFLSACTQISDDNSIFNPQKPVVEEKPIDKSLLENIWIEGYPIQCLGNPWEQEWLEQNDNNYAAYPQSKQDRLAIMKNYYVRQDKTIYEAKILTFEELFGENVGVCEACSCSAGYVLYLLVPQKDVDWWLNFSYMNKEITSKLINLHFNTSKGSENIKIK